MQKLRTSHSVLAGPFTGSRLVLSSVWLVLTCDVGNQRVVGVCISEQRADWQQNLWNCERRRPLILQDVKTNTSVRVDVGVVYFGDELELWWLEGVICGEVDVEEEDTASKGRVVWSHDSCLPMELVGLVLRTSWAVGGWVLAKIDKFFLDTLQGHFIKL